MLTWPAVFIHWHPCLYVRIFYYWYFITFTVFSILKIYYVHTGKQSKRYFCPIKCCTNKHSQQEVLNNVNTQISIFASLHIPYIVDVVYVTMYVCTSSYMCLFIKIFFSPSWKTIFFAVLVQCDLFKGNFLDIPFFKTSLSLLKILIY